MQCLVLSRTSREADTAFVLGTRGRVPSASLLKTLQPEEEAAFCAERTVASGSLLLLPPCGRLRRRQRNPN